jgi:hypothetical protein
VNSHHELQRVPFGEDDGGIAGRLLSIEFMFVLLVALIPTFRLRHSVKSSGKRFIPCSAASVLQPCDRQACRVGY